MDDSSGNEEDRALSMRSLAGSQTEASGVTGDSEQMMDMSHSEEEGEEEEEESDDGSDDSEIDIIQHQRFVSKKLEEGESSKLKEEGESSSTQPSPARKGVTMESRRKKFQQDAETRRIHACKEHNRKERVRRKSMKVTVLELWKQLRKPPKKASYISVLKSARDEIKDLTAIKEKDGERLDTLKKEHSRLKWKLEEMLADIKKIPADSKPYSPTSASHSLPSPSSPLLPPNIQPCFPPRVPNPQGPPRPLVVGPGMIVPSIINLGNMPPFSSPPHHHLPAQSQASFLMYSPHFPPLMRPPGNLIGIPPFCLPPPPPLSSNLPGIVPPRCSETTYIPSSHFPISLCPQPPNQLGGLPGLMNTNPFFLTRGHPHPSLFFNHLASQDPVFPVTVFKERLSRTEAFPSDSSPYNTSLLLPVPSSLSPPPLLPSSQKHLPQTIQVLTNRESERSTDYERTPSDSDSVREPLLIVDVEDDDDTTLLPPVFTDTNDSSSSLERKEEETSMEDVTLDYDQGEKKTKRGFRSSSTDSESEGNCSPGLGGRRRPLTGRRNNITPTSCTSSSNHRNSGKKTRNKKAGMHCRVVNRSIPPLLKVKDPEVQRPDLGEEDVKIILKNCQISRTFESKLQLLPPCPKLFNHINREGGGDGDGVRAQGKAKFCWVDEGDDDIVERSVKNFKRKFSDFNSDLYVNSIAIPQS